MNHEPFVPAKTQDVGPYSFAHKHLKGSLHPNGNPYTARTLFLYNVAQVLYKHNRLHVSGKKIVSNLTRKRRFTEILSFAHDLHNLGFKVIYPTSLQRKHVLALTHYWESCDDLTGSTVSQKRSVLRIFLTWMKKEKVMSMLTDAEMFINPEYAKRSNVVKTNKSWGESASVLERIAHVETLDPHVARQLKISHFFGLRKEEAMLFKPHLDFDEENSVLLITRGTKGGKHRVVLVETPEQLAAVIEVRERCYSKNDSTIPRMQKSLMSWTRYFYRVCHKSGLTKKNGLTAHGLRHGYAHRSYELLTGNKSAAVNANQPPLTDTIKDKIARAIISRQMGHVRTSIVSAYIGSNTSQEN